MASLGQDDRNIECIVNDILDNDDWIATKEQVKKDIDLIDEHYIKIRNLLKRHSSNQSKCYALMEDDNGHITAVKSINLEESISAFSLKTRLDSTKNHPNRILGALLLPKSMKKELSPLIFKINILKLLFKKRLNKSLVKYNDRVKLLRSVVPALLVQSVYRKIHEAPVSIYRINYAWSDKSRSVKYISYTDALNILEMHADQMIETGAAEGMTRDQLLENDKSKLTATGLHERYVIVKPIKAFPQQTFNYKADNGDLIRVVIKATTPLICYFDDASKIIHKEPKLPQHITNGVYSKYVPVMPERNLYICGETS
ncbi:hypothetical protein UA32_12360 [Photobacterium angustum]|uniref:Uncharacterized protein n=1 Tax=Photobacterium angustum TaxID=661 RepID=A0ABX5GYD6_PHOAN|nr:DNA replication terminus site-binding protein [Photobacterium angustum]KJG37742.1 hypothetical protein UA32_12360 [Photobacterium angustum]PSX03922.1 hypothetical protein C0W27_20720 [Photobacterium angustum]